MKKFLSIFFIIQLFIISHVTTVKANPWLVFEGINLGIMILDEISGKKGGKKTIKKTVNNSNNKTVKKLPQSIPVATSQNPYDGAWTGYDKCYSRNNNDRDFNYTIIINKGTVLLANQHAINSNIYQNNFKSLVMKGKVLNNRKVGINGIYGFLGGKFSSKSRLVLKYQDNPSCQFTMTKVNNNTANQTTKNNNTGQVYCQNKYTKSLLWERNNYCRSNEIQISQTKFKQLKQSKAIASSNDNSIFYCKTEKGRVYSLLKSSNKSCGYREISKVEFDARKNTKTLIAKDNSKKDDIFKKAEKGNVYSQAVMGWRYQYGEDGFSKDLKQSLKWYKLAAKQNHSYSLAKIGYFYHNGLGGLTKNKNTAFNYFNDALKHADNENDKKNSNFNLGIYYQYGYGSANKDFIKALNYYKNAKKHGHEDAQNKILEINKLIASNKTNDYVYCQNKYNENLLSERYLRCDSSERKVSKTKFNQLKQNKKIVSSEKFIYCKDKNGNLYSRQTSLYNNCGGMTQISKAAFDLDNFNKQNTDKEIKQNIVIAKDIAGPVIKVANSFEAGSNLQVIVSGFVSDDNDIAQVTVDGDDVALTNGGFSQKLYVKPKGQNIIITAMDKFGNQSSKTIQLKRSTQKTVAKIFEDLNPTIIRSKINSSSVALIIGVEDYQSTFAAPYAANDALIFNDFANTSLGVPQQNIKLLMNNEAGRANTLKAVAKWLPKVVKEDNTDIYIFFSGHGLASDDGEDLYLLPSDGDPELLEDTTLMRTQLFERIAKLNPRSVTVFLDTCYSGATRTDEFLVAAKPIFIEAQEQDIPANFTVFSASAGRETAKVLTEAQHGLFSYYMMKGLEGEADINSDNKITNGELITFVNKNVSKQANQTPQLNGDPDKVLVQW